MPDLREAFKEALAHGDLHAEPHGLDRGQLTERFDVGLTDFWKLRRYRCESSGGRSDHGCARAGPAMQQAS